MSSILLILSKPKNLFLPNNRAYTNYSPRIVNLMGENYSDIGNQWVLTYDEFRNVARDVREATIGLLNDHT